MLRCVGDTLAGAGLEPGNVFVTTEIHPDGLYDASA